MNTMFLIAHALPLEQDRAPQSIIVASVTLDPAYTRGVNCDKLLRGIAGRLGLFDFEVVVSDAQQRPGEQMSLPFPTKR